MFAQLPMRIAATALCAALAGAAHAETYYVAPNGSPSNNGSRAKPWNLDWAVKQLKGGDTLIAKPGLYIGGATVPGQNFVTGNGLGIAVAVEAVKPAISTPRSQSILMVCAPPHGVNASATSWPRALSPSMVAAGVPVSTTVFSPSKKKRGASMACCTSMPTQKARRP